MESQSRFVVVASLALLLTSVNAQMAPAPGPLPNYQGQGLINGAPANVPSTPNYPNPGPNNYPTGIPSAPGPGGQPMPPAGPSSTTTQPGTAVGTSAPPPPSTTSPPVTSAPVTTAVVAFITKLNLDSPSTFNTVKPDGVNTYNQLWCQNLIGNSGAICSATATAGSVNVDTVLTYPPTHAAASAANALTDILHAIAANPTNASLIGALIPTGVNASSLGFLGLSGIQVQQLNYGPVGAPLMAPPMAPGLPSITFTYAVRLGLATPADFTPALQAAWCGRLTANSNRATCSIRSVVAGSVVVTTDLTYLASDSASQAALASTLQAIQQNPSLASSFFGNDFGTIEPLSISSAVGAPYMAPAMAPGLAPTTTPLPPITFTFVVRLSLATPADFTPALQAAWCKILTANTNNAICSIRSVVAGSVVVTTDMTYSASDSASEGALASRLQAIQQNPSLASSFFGNDFGTIQVLSIGTSAVPPPPPPPAKHGLSGGKIAGAVIGSVAGAAILGGCGFAGYKYYHTRRAYQPAV